MNTMNMTRATVTKTMSLAQAEGEYCALKALATGYDQMSPSEQRSFDRRLGAWICGHRCRCDSRRGCREDAAGDGPFRSRQRPPPAAVKP